MRILTRILIVLVVLVVILGAVGFLLPRDVHVERSITIDAPPATIHPLVADFNNWPAWIPWNKERDATLEQKVEGPAGAVGSKYSWKAKKLGEGIATLTKSDPNTGIEYDLVFGGDTEPTKGSMKFAPAEGGTQVTWTFDADMGLWPPGRYVGLFMDSLLGADFEEGLAKLKTLAEK